MAYHLFVSKCARVGGLGVINGDSVDDEGVDIAGRLGSNHWRGFVVCRFDRRKRIIDEGRDSEVLAWVDFKGRHGLAPGQDREKVGEEHVEVHLSAMKMYQCMHCDGWQVLFPFLHLPFFVCQCSLELSSSIFAHPAVVQTLMHEPSFSKTRSNENHDS